MSNKFTISYSTRAHTHNAISRKLRHFPQFPNSQQMYNSMKHTLKPLYSIWLLILMAAIVTIHVMFHEKDSFLLLNNENPLAKTSKKPIFNATLLRYASIDVSEPKLNQEIKELLDGIYHDKRRSYLSSNRNRIDTRLKAARAIRLKLHSTESQNLWSDFKSHLKKWSKNRIFLSDSMLDLVYEVKGLIDEYNGVKGLRKKYKSCAVVGNSGILLKTSYGELIDSHEAVFRLNNARSTSFERNVGSKTSVSFVNSNILHLCARRDNCFCHPYGENVPIVMYICQPAHFLDYLVCNASHRSPLIVTDPRFDVLCARIVKYYSLKRFVEVTGKDVGEWGSIHDEVNFHYSSGMQAVMLALGICEKVSVLGFGKSELARHHYHTNQKVELSLHDYEAEYEIYRDLMEQPEVIPFVSDSFKVPPLVMYH